MSVLRTWAVFGLIVISGCFAAIARATPVVNLYAHPSGGAPSGITGQLFEMADEFVVPANQVWTATGVIFDGFATLGPNYVITFYLNPAGSPGQVLCQRSGAFPIGPLEPGIGQIRNPEFRLSSACTLPAGNYFVAIRSTGGTTFQIRTTPTLVGNEARLRDASASNVCGTNFVPMSSCLATINHDLRFTIRGCTTGSCEFPLVATAACSGDDLVLAVADGDAPYTLSGTGPGLPLTNVAAGTYTFDGPAVWDALRVTEQSGDQQMMSFGLRNCGPHEAVVAQSGDDTIVDESQPTSTDTYSIALSGPPDPGETVTITPSSTDTVTGVTTSPAQLLFDASNWNQPQMVTVTVVDDDVFENGLHTTVIEHPLTTTGGAYTGVTVPDLTVTVLDDDEDVFADGFE